MGISRGNSNRFVTAVWPYCSWNDAINSRYVISIVTPRLSMKFICTYMKPSLLGVTSFIAHLTDQKKMSFLKLWILLICTTQRLCAGPGCIRNPPKQKNGNTRTPMATGMCIKKRAAHISRHSFKKKHLLKRWGQCRVNMDVSDGLKRCDSSQSDGKLPKGLYIDYIYR